MKKVSVIIPVHGVEQYIAATVQSVLSQTYQNFEILIIDDESPDNSIKVCQTFTDSRIKIIRQKNRGLAGARNTGIRHSQGEYLAFIDGDDLWLPEKLKKHVEHLDKFPSVGVSFSRSALIDESGNLVGTYLMPQLKNITVPCLLRSNLVGNGSTPVIRREVFEDIKFKYNLYDAIENCYFDEQFRRAEDIECWLRIAIQTNWQIEGIPEALTLYRVNSEGLSANLFKQLEAWEQVLEKIRSYAPELVNRWESIARANQLQILARIAVRLKARSEAMTLIHRAISTDWHILLEEPRRTLLTLAAAYMLWLLPKPLYCQIEAFVSKKTGRLQKQHILQGQSEQPI